MDKKLKSFIEKALNKHGDKLSFKNSIYDGLEKPITYQCNIHGEVTWIAKNVLKHKGCPFCTEEDVIKRRRKRSRKKGNSYELQIIKELTELGYNGLKSSRSESKNLDNNKIDIADTGNVLPCYFQIKKTTNIPSFFKIESECSLKDKPFCIIWNSQESKEGNVNMTSKGEIAMVPKDFFYKLLNSYKNG